MDAIEKFRHYLQVDDRQFRILFACAVAARLEACYQPVVFVRGPYDSGKTTRCMFLVATTMSRDKPMKPVSLASIVHPFPDQVDDHFIAAEKLLGVLYDNLDHENPKVYRAICITSTGGSIIRRKLYTDNTLIPSGRPILVVYNGLSIGDLPEDLLSRHVILDVKRPPDEVFMDEDELLSRFCDDLPDIQRAIDYLSAHAATMLAKRDTKRTPLPHSLRLSTYARVGQIVAKQLGWPDFVNDYKALIGTAAADTTVMAKVLAYLGKRLTTGTYKIGAAGLYDEISMLYPDFPQHCPTPSALGKLFVEHENDLKAACVVSRKSMSNGHAIWTFKRVGLAAGSLGP